VGDDVLRWDKWGARVGGGGGGDINWERCQGDPIGVELIPSAFHQVINSMMGGIVSIL